MAERAVQIAEGANKTENIVVVAGLVIMRNSVLVHEVDRNQWLPPSYELSPGQSHEDTLVAGIEHDTGIACKVERLVAGTSEYVYGDRNGEVSHPLSVFTNLTFECSAGNGSMNTEASRNGYKIVSLDSAASSERFPDYCRGPLRKILRRVRDEA